MPLHLDYDIDLESDNFRRFLADVGNYEDINTSFAFPVNIPDGYEQKSSATRPNQVGGELFDLNYPTIEIWKLFQRGDRLVGTHRFTVIRSRDVYLSTQWSLHPKVDLGWDKIAILKDVMLNLTINEDQIDEASLQAAIKAAIGDDISMDDFILTSVFVAKKRGVSVEANMPNQGVAIRNMYDGSNPQSESRSVIHAGNGPTGNDTPSPDLSLEDWSRARKAYWVYQHTIESLENGGESSELGDIVSWVEEEIENLDIEDVRDIASAIVNHLIPPDCGKMYTHLEKLVSLFGYPEFRVKWIPKTIKIGCARVTITLPKVEWRITNVVCYAFYRIPKNTMDFLIRICATCAVKAGLISGVVGIVAGNPAAAAATFTPAFKTCIRDDITDCVHPGLSLIKESQAWN